VWPPTLSAGLLWKRAEGELLWRVLHGMKGRNGEPTMPGFAAALDTADVWALLDGMKALSAGDSALREASWPWPVRAPDVGVNCEGAAPRSLAQWKGQRIRIVAGGAALAPPAEDPRFVTVLLQADAAEPRADCVATTRAAWQAYASVAGVTASALPGTQFIVDRDGWLRALGRPGQRGWSEDNLICRSDATPASASAGTADRNATPIDGLGALIARMDADPVRTARLGLPHSR
jgi:hypothetical protein